MDRKYGESLDHWQTNKKHEDKRGDISKSSVAGVLYHESCRFTAKKRYNEALTLINVAIENIETNFEFHNQKAIILESLNRYSESSQAYDRALELNEIDEIYENKARMLYKWANSLNDKNQALNLISEAIEILPVSSKDKYFEKFWYLKGSIFDCLGDPVESRRCYLMAEGMRDEINELDTQIDFLNNSKDILINITGTRFYFGMEPFRKGVIVNLIRESDNEHDPDAIRVELDGETVGYVANNDYTLIENVRSATEIRGLKITRAEVVLIYLDEYVIAKLLQ